MDRQHRAFGQSPHQCAHASRAGDACPRSIRFGFGRRSVRDLCRPMGAHDGLDAGPRRAAGDAANASCEAFPSRGAGRSAHRRHAVAAQAPGRDGERRAAAAGLSRAAGDRRFRRSPDRRSGSRQRSRRSRRRPPRNAPRRCRRPTTSQRNCPPATAAPRFTISRRTRSFCPTASDWRRIRGSATRWTTRASSK